MALSNKLRIILRVSSVYAVLLSMSQTLYAFGLEFWATGQRYHYEMARETLRQRGLPADLIAWGDDALDVYINGDEIKPIGKWNSGEFRRHFKHDWERVHFDELPNAQAVADQWDRYMYGAYYGLVWIAQEHAVETNSDRKRALLIAAYNLLGVTMHAYEDFYSHSTWINREERRSSPAITYKRNDFVALEKLYTGWYDHTGATAQPHGQKSWKDKCVPAIGGRIPDLGINLDRTCSAAYAVMHEGKGRYPDWTGPRPKSPQEAMNYAIMLAKKTTEAVLMRLEDWMRASQDREVSNFWVYIRRLKWLIPPVGSRWGLSSFDQDNPYALSIRPLGFLSGGDESTPMMNTLSKGYTSEKPGRWMFRVLLETDGVSVGKTGTLRTHSTVGSYRYPLTNGLNRITALKKSAQSMAFYVGEFDTKLPHTFQLTMNGSEFPHLRRVQVYAYWIGSGKSRAHFGKIIDTDVKTSATQDSTGAQYTCKDGYCEWRIQNFSIKDMDIDINAWADDEPLSSSPVVWSPIPTGNACAKLGFFGKCNPNLPSTPQSCGPNMIFDDNGQCRPIPFHPSQTGLHLCATQKSSAYLGQNLTRYFGNSSGWSGQFAVWIYQQCGRSDVQWGSIGPQGYGPKGGVRLIRGTTGIQPGDIANYTDGNRFGIVERIDGNQVYVIQGDRPGRVVAKDVWQSRKIYGYYRTQ